MATLAGTTSTADTVHIIFGHIRQFKVHHLRQLLDVQAASRDIGGYQNTHLTLFEIRQRTGAGTL